MFHNRPKEIKEEDNTSSKNANYPQLEQPQASVQVKTNTDKHTRKVVLGSIDISKK